MGKDKLMLAGLGVAAGIPGVLVLGMVIFNTLGRVDLTYLLGLCLFLFIGGGALALVARSGLLNGRGRY